MTNDKIPNDEARMTKATGLSPTARHAHFIPHSDFGLHSSLGISSFSTSQFDSRFPFDVRH